MDPLHVAMLVLLGLITIFSALGAMYSMQAASHTSTALTGRDKRAASYPVVWSVPAPLEAVLKPLDPGACALQCGEACMDSPNVAISAHCARKCANACGFDFV